MTPVQIRYSLILLGFLDIVSFWRTFDTSLFNFDSWNHIMPILNAFLVLTLLASGILLVMDKKLGIVIYYIQFPLRMLFLILTFGFVVSLTNLQIDTLGYKIALTLAMILELCRLIYSIWTYKNYFRPKKTAST